MASWNLGIWDSFAVTLSSINTFEHESLWNFFTTL